MNLSHRFFSKRILILLIFIILIVGFFIGNQYGQTWDEPSFYLYGERSWDAYTRGLTGQPLIPEKHIYFLDLRYYGAFYTAIGWKAVELLKPVLKNWGYMDIWHFINFAFFQIALVSLYFLAKRYFSPRIALFSVLLFATQPLIFGHAFINPKDIPFMTSFMASVTLGLYMTDAVKKDSEVNSRWQFELMLSILFGLLVFSVVGKDVLGSAIGNLITSLYTAPADSVAGRLFLLLTGTANRLPVENYIHKAVSAHLERIFVYAAFIFLVFIKIYTNHRENKTSDPLFRLNWRGILLVLASGIALGLATSVRLLAPFAGLLVALYALGTRGRNSLPALIYYFSIAAFVSYLTWPFLWDSPTYNFLEAFNVMRDFPFNAEIRFMGDNISPSNLPWYYIPLLMSIQLTVPLVLLAWAGFLALIRKSNRQNIFANFVVLGWLLPVGLQIALKSNAYDNFRQFLFVLPPLFILAGMGFEMLLSWIKNQTAAIVLSILCLLPGLLGIIALHPVQYIYYNEFVGNVSGAEGKFELDYWLSSYREAAAYLDVVAPFDADVLAWGSGFNGTRDDITVYSFSSEDDLKNTDLKFDYAVITTRFDSHLGVFKDAPVVYEIRKDGALLAVIKKITK